MIVNKASVDWFTIGSYRYTDVVEYIENHYALGGDLIKRMQYEGLLRYWSGGSVFVGKGEQKSKEHYLVQVSGDLSDKIFNEITSLVTQDDKFTRIDLQLTLPKPDFWSQVEYMAHCEAAGLKPTNDRSSGLIQPELMTVYTGTRGSGRLNRLYEKEGEDGLVYLRFETEFGRQYANAVAVGLRHGMDIQDFLNGEVDRKKVEWLDLFRIGDRKVLPKPERVKSNGKTERWLLNTVLPALVKYANSHDSDDAVLKTIRAALDRNNKTA